MCIRDREDTAHSRIYDRLLSMCVPVRFTGDNFRQETAKRKMESMKKLITEMCIRDSYGISQSEFLRQAIRRATIRPVVHVSSVNDEMCIRDSGRPVHVGQERHFLNPQAVYDDMHMNVAAVVMPVRVGADKGLVAGKMLFTELFPQRLRPVYGLSLIHI